MLNNTLDNQITNNENANELPDSDIATMINDYISNLSSNMNLSEKELSELSSKLQNKIKKLKLYNLKKDLEELYLETKNEVIKITNANQIQILYKELKLYNLKKDLEELYLAIKNKKIEITNAEQIKILYQELSQYLNTPLHQELRECLNKPFKELSQYLNTPLYQELRKYLNKPLLSALEKKIDAPTSAATFSTNRVVSCELKNALKYIRLYRPFKGFCVK